MKITTIGRATIGGTLARLWTDAGHDVTTLGRDGGNASDADVVLLAVPHTAVADALTSITGLDGKVILDATNRLDGSAPPVGFASIAEFVAARTNGRVAKVFNLNFGDILPRAAHTARRASNIWTGDPALADVVRQLSADIGLEAVYGGPLERAGTQEDFGYFLNSINGDLDRGFVFYRFATPDEL